MVSPTVPPRKDGLPHSMFCGTCRKSFPTNDLEKRRDGVYVCKGCPKRDTGRKA